jgi:hypothetical protein
MADISAEVKDSSETEQEVIDPISLFTPAVQKRVEGLMYLGQLTDDSIRFCGHTFGLRTLRPQHHFAISQVLQPYRNSTAEVDMYEALHVGMALTHVDGDRHFCDPIGPDVSLEDLARARLFYIGNGDTGWYPATISYLWGEYQLLESAATKAVIELHSLSLRGEPKTSSPWLDSLIESASSPEETPSVIPLFTAFNSH